MLKFRSDMYKLGRKCIFCHQYGLYKLGDKKVKCKNCKKRYSLYKLRKDLDILYYFYLELSARKAAREMGINYMSIHSRYMFFRRKIEEYLNKEFSKLCGELEMDESYFGGKRKGKRGRGANNKAIVFGIVSRTNMKRHETSLHLE